MTVAWTGEVHDQFEARIGEVVDPDLDDDPDAPTVWASDVVTSEDGSITCGETLEEGKQDHVFVREHNVWGWGPWSASRHRFTVLADNVMPKNVSVSPDSGEIATDTPTAFIATYSDHAGYRNIRSTELLIDESTLDGVEACRLVYDASENLCWLATTDNTEFVGGYAPGSSEVIENDQVKVHLDQTSVSTDDTQLAVTWNLEFKAPSAGDKKIALSVTNGRGLSDPESPEELGTTTIVAPGPTSRITSPANGASLSTSSVSVTGTATDTTGIGKVEVSTDGGTTWADAAGMTSWSYTWSGMDDGDYVLKTRATNTASPAQVETTGTGVKVTVDTHTPHSSITSPSNGATITGDSIYVEGSVSDGIGKVQKVELSFDGGSTWVDASGGSYFSYPFPVTQSGTYTVRSRATDTAGNVETPGDGITVTVLYRAHGEGIR